MRKIQFFSVAPRVPERLRFLETLARNLWWCWNVDAIELFRRIDAPLWRESGRSPLHFLRLVPQSRFEAMARDESFLSHFARVQKRFEAGGAPAGDLPPAAEGGGCVAYFSLEYGVHESIHMYSGGLGALAGDHLKAASDLGVPLVAVGLLYREGYFQQHLSDDGWQQERRPENLIHDLPVRKATTAAGEDVRVSLRLPEGVLSAAVWRMDVGRVPVFMLDTNLPENRPEFRDVTARLYDDDRRTRLRQELLLGIGGFNALLRMGCEPAVCHLNEGHAAFLSLARIAHLTKKGLAQETVLEIVPRSNVFTTHTPVPAGNECFDAGLVREHLAAMKDDLGIDPDAAVGWGKPVLQPDHNEFSMTIFGLRTAFRSNGVSRLHGQTARRMWGPLWPSLPLEEIPISHVTNGIHVPSWLSPFHTVLYEQYLGPSWMDQPDGADVAARVDQIPDEELWRAHELARSRLVRSAREFVEQQFRARNATRSDMAQAKSLLDNDVLTIGFARRFTQYKRNTLLLRNPERLEALLTNPDRPVQLVFSGKAHPADDRGKDLIRQVVHFARKANVRRRVVFLENYDIHVARRMVQGVDVWLNTPRRPQEASGTSGMKAALNGGLHVSVLDGWWCEGYTPQCGWAIGGEEEYADPEAQDNVEAQSLYNTLENEVVPCFYDRTLGDIPHAWIRMMKASVRMALGMFSSHRMVREYQSKFYTAAAAEYRSLLADDAALARRLVAEHRRLRSLWTSVRMEPPQVDRDLSGLHVGDTFGVTAVVHLGQLRPEDVDVQVYYGPVDSKNRIADSRTVEMSRVKDMGRGAYVYRREVKCETTGRYGFTARVRPSGQDWRCVMPGFVTWADGA